MTELERILKLIKFTILNHIVVSALRIGEKTTDNQKYIGTDHPFTYLNLHHSWKYGLIKLITTLNDLWNQLSNNFYIKNLERRLDWYN